MKKVNQPMEMKEFPQIDNTKETIINLIILDKSGSMDCIRKAVVTGFNETLNGIRAAQTKFSESQEHFVSLMVFCDCDKHFIYENEPIANVSNLEYDDYQPCCCTPLYDAMGLSLSRLSHQVEKIINCTVVATIITDGLENASREFSGKQIKNLVETLTAKGWTFAYMGTNHDVGSVADELSIMNVHEFEDTETGMSDSFAFEAQKRMDFFSERDVRFSMNKFMTEDEIVAEKRSMSMNFYKDAKTERMEKPTRTFRVSPDRINKLALNEIFVFGSNLEGRHGGGAARMACQKFGAVYGQGVGLQGQSYAIPTMQGGIETIKPYVDEFIVFAKHHPEMSFLVTRIGCGIAGFDDSQIAPLFKKAADVENIKLPETFWKILKK